jgi:hypothetical protein
MYVSRVLHGYIFVHFLVLVYVSLVLYYYICPTSASLVFYYHACVLIARECIRPLLPVLLSAFGAGGVISGAHSSRLQRLISAMAGGGVAQLSVGVGGSLLRAYCGTNARDAAGRAGTHFAAALSLPHSASRSPTSPALTPALKALSGLYLLRI